MPWVDGSDTVTQRSLAEQAIAWSAVLRSSRSTTQTASSTASLTEIASGIHPDSRLHPSGCVAPGVGRMGRHLPSASAVSFSDFQAFSNNSSTCSRLMISGGDNSIES